MLYFGSSVYYKRTFQEGFIDYQLLTCRNYSKNRAFFIDRGKVGLKLLDRSFATSALVDKNTAWVCEVGYHEKIYQTKDIKNYLENAPNAYRRDKMHVRSVAAF